MLKHKTAYRITAYNYRYLSFISGFDIQTMTANLGWFATYSETRKGCRWQIVPRSVIEEKMLDFSIEEDAFHHEGPHVLQGV
jgi:hypothetical protein